MLDWLGLLLSEAIVTGVSLETRCLTALSVVKSYYANIVKKVDFLIIGAQKSATTSLRSFLSEGHDEIYMHHTELHFWNRDNQYQDGQGLGAYLQNFSGASSNQIVGEKSPSYLPSEVCPARIANHFPSVKLIAILRNPAERAYSAFWHGKRVGAIAQSMSFGESIRNYKENGGTPYGDLITQGFYARHLLRYLDHFPSQQLKIMDFKVIKQDTRNQLSGVLDFLLPEGSNSKVNLNFPKRNVARVSRVPSFSEFIHKNNLLNYKTKSRILKTMSVAFEPPMMLAEDAKFLSEIYALENEKLNQLTGIDFNNFTGYDKNN